MSDQAVLDLRELKGETELAIYDLQGKLMRTEKTATNRTFNLERGNLSTGSYLLQLLNANHSYKLLFVIE